MFAAPLPSLNSILGTGAPAQVVIVDIWAVGPSGAASPSSNGWPIGGIVALGVLGASPVGAIVTHGTSGALTGQGSTTAGVANRFRAMSAVGVLTGPGSAIAGSANRFRNMTATGALVGPGSTISGAASRFRAMGSTGAILGTGSIVVGVASRSGSPAIHGTTGAITGAGATITGSSSNGDAPANYYGSGNAKGAENYLIQKVNEKYAAIEKAQRLDAAIQPRNDVLDRAILEAKRRQSVENIKRRAFAKAKAHADTIAAAQDQKRQQSITLAETLKADAERRRSAEELESSRRKVQEASEAREAAQRAVVILGRDIATAQDAFRQSERAKVEAAKRAAAQALEDVRKSSRQAAKIRAELAKASEIPMPTSLQAQAIRAQAIEDDQIMTLMAMMLLAD